MVALGGDEPPGPPLAVAVAAWAVFELVLYQVRYLLNDLADAAALVTGGLLHGRPAAAGTVVLVSVCVVAAPVLVGVVPRPVAGWAAAAPAVAACPGAAGGDGAGTAVLVFCVAGPVAAFRTFSPASLDLAPAPASARSADGAPAGPGPA